MREQQETKEAEETELEYVNDIDDNENRVMVVMFGDSIYGNFQSNYGEDASVSSLVSDITGYNVVNAGFGGCRMANHLSENYNPFCMPSLANACVTGDFSFQHEILNKSDDVVPYYFDETISKLEKLDFSNIDAIVIEYGINDYQGDVLLDNELDPLDIYTFGGAMRYTINKLLSEYPNIVIFFQLPTRFFRNIDGEMVDISKTQINATGNTLDNYIMKEIEICSEYGCPYIDSYHCSEFNELTHEWYYHSPESNVHLGINGRKRLAQIISGNLKFYFDRE